jgi:hypothetical protein
MIGFKNYITEDVLPSYLLEGGNVNIDGQDAESIDMELHDREAVSDLIMKALVEINTDFKKEAGLYLWKPSVLKQGQVFSGSTKHFFDSNITTEKFLEHKKKIGDIDLMTDINLKAQIKTFIEMHKGDEYGALTLIGSKPSGDQLITLWKLQPQDINVQVDLEFVIFQNDEPTEWSKFSHSSAFEDLEKGIKGAMHKILMTSLLGHKKTDSVLQMKTKQKEIKAGIHALSIKGLRKKYEQIGTQDGKPVIRETGAKEFITNFYEIIKEVFDKEATEEDIKLFWSFSGILELMKANLKKAKIKKILEDFVDRLFGPDAQGLYKGDPNRDLDEKMAAVKMAEQELDVNFSRQDLERIQKLYYERYK